MLPAPLGTVLDRLPLLSDWRRRRRLQRRFADEMRLLAGDRVQSDRPSVLFFTVHKCASTFTGEAVARLAGSAGLVPIDFEAYFYLGGTSEKNIYERDWGAAEAFRPQGYAYGPLRQFNPAIPDLDAYRILLMLRDPRDVLTSLYYSVAFSHSVPTGNPVETADLLRRRQSALERGLDRFVLDEAPTYHERYRQYADHLAGKPNVLFVKYEELLADAKGWLTRVADFIVGGTDASLLEELAAQAEPPDAPEDAERHIRQRLPGDHRRKLEAETIGQLNARFGSLLPIFGYPP